MFVKSAAVVGLVMIIIGITGCDTEPPVDPEIAERHAELQARYHGELSAVTARQMVLLHPMSDRQRQAREQLLWFEEHQDRLIERDDLVWEIIDGGDEAPSP